MGIKDDINLILRDHEGYTGDGRGGVGDLPVGDRSTARKPISKRDLREVLGAVHDSVADPADAAMQAAEDAIDAAERAELAASGVEYPVSYAPQTLTEPQQAQARDNIGAADSATAVTGSRTVTAAAGLTGGGDLTADRTLKADFASPAEALAGVATDKVMSPAGVRVAAVQAAAEQALGVGQDYVDVRAIRGRNTTYHNTLERPIIVAINTPAYNGRIQVSHDGSSWMSVTDGEGGGTQLALIKSQQYYRLSQAATDGIRLWVEVR